MSGILPAADDRTKHDTGPPGRWRALLVILVTVGIAAVGIIAVRPHVAHRLEVRDAYRKLKTSERQDAVQWLIRNGENPDDALLRLLHGDEHDLTFAAEQLSRRPATPQITGTVLRTLEDRQLVQRAVQDHSEVEFCRGLIRVLGRHAESHVDALTETDQRIIALLKPALSDSNVLAEDAAQVLAEYLARDSSLRAWLRPYLDEQKLSLYGRLAVLRGFFRSDPDYLTSYLHLLVAGASSEHSFTTDRAFAYLRELGPAARPAVTQLQELRDRIPRLTIEIDRALRAIEFETPGQ